MLHATVAAAAAMTIYLAVLIVDNILVPLALLVDTHNDTDRIDDRAA